MTCLFDTTMEVGKVGVAVLHVGAKVTCLFDTNMVVGKVGVAVLLCTVKCNWFCQASAAILFLEARQSTPTLTHISQHFFFHCFPTLMHHSAV